jgi:hypothetical protein
MNIKLRLSGMRRFIWCDSSLKAEVEFQPRKLKVKKDMNNQCGSR